MPDGRQIDMEPSPAVAERETLVPYSLFQEWQRRRGRGLPPDPPPAGEAAIARRPVAAPTHER